MAVASFPEYESAVKAYESLVQLRNMRDIKYKDEAMKYRPRNEDNHIWYSAQYRPIYTQEAVTDLNTVIEHLQQKTTIHWEDEWRKGDQKHWNSQLVKHEHMNRAVLRQQTALLDELRKKSREAFKKLKDRENHQKQKAENEAAKAAAELKSESVKSAGQSAASV